MFKGIYSLGQIYSSLVSPLGLVKPADGENPFVYKYQYQIVDSNLIEDHIGACKKYLFNTLVRCGAVISCYESHYMNVPYNIFLYHKYMVENYTWYVLEDEIRYNLDETPHYKEYFPMVKSYIDRYNSLKAFW